MRRDARINQIHLLLTRLIVLAQRRQEIFLAVKLPHVRSVPSETVRSINAAEKPLVRAGSKSEFALL